MADPLLILAAGPLRAPQAERVELVWSGNTAAAIGAVACLLALAYWAFEREIRERKERGDGRQDRD